jgi:spermidine synthase
MGSAEFREHDPFAPIVYSYPGVTVLHEERSPFQEISVLEHPHFGKVLTLDGVVQLTEWDEFFYHEMLVHPAMHVHYDPLEVLIIGGGDGGSLREALKHPGVQRVTMAEIDQRVVEVSKQFFPTLSVGFSNPKANVIHTDGVKLVEQVTSTYDVIIVDSTDPVGQAEALFTSPFYQAAHRALKSDGVLVAQTESLLFHASFVRDVQQRLREIFPIVDCYTQALATYAGNWWTFSMASKTHDPRRPQANRRIKVRYYSAQVHHKAFLTRALYRRMLNGTLGW